MDPLSQLRQHFDSVTVCDFEFSQPEGSPPSPSALCFRDLITGERGQYRRDELLTMRAAPFPVHDRAMMVAHYAVAELSCFESLGWQHPRRVIDTLVEEKVRRFGLPCGYGYGLLACLAAYGLPVRDGTYKAEMQAIGMAGGPTSPEQWGPFLRYCMEDVDDCAALFLAQLPYVDLPRALIRGRYMGAVARMESVGVPVDVPLLEHMRQRWPAIEAQIIDAVNPHYGVYVGGSFSIARFERWLVANRIPWPRLPTGVLDLEAETFREQAKSYPAVSRLREARHALGKMRLFSDISVGPDGRNRSSLRPFGSRTGRNQPSSAKFIFGASRSVRGLIRATPGHGIAYLDFASQEFMIGAALSGDERMLAAYASGDVYLAFAKQAGAVPPDATKATHEAERDLFKACVLATQYGMGSKSLAHRIGRPEVEARELLRMHREAYPRFWHWSETAVARAMYAGSIRTTFGWPLHIHGADERGKPTANPRSISNFPCQAHGSEILRLACSSLTEAGIRVCCPVHDAVLIEAPLEELDATVEQAQRLMREASAVVLNGAECRVDAAVYRYPTPYSDKAGKDFWTTLLRLAGPMPE
jgi:DNA polymerase I